MKLNYKRTFLVGFAFLSICAFWQVYNTLVPLILKNTFNMGDTVSGLIMALDNILALFMLPLFGTLSDKVATPIGKRMPFILAGTAVAVVTMMFMPLADNARNLTLFVVALLVALVAMGSYRSPAVALMPDVTPKPLRSKANAIINLMGALGGIFTFALLMFLVPDVAKPDYTVIFVIVAVLMVVSVAVLFLNVKENKLVAEREAIDKTLPPTKAELELEASKGKKMPKDVKKSLILILLSVFFWFTAYNAVETALSKYATVYLGMEVSSFAGSMMVAMAGAIISYVPAGMIATKIGRKKTILGAIVLMTVGFALAFTIKKFSFFMTVILFIVGVGWGALNTNSYPMVVEMSRGSDIGKYTGYYYTFSMAAQIATPIVSGYLLEHVGYQTLFPYAAVFMAVAFVSMLFVKHGDSKPSLPSNKQGLLVDAED